MRKFRTWLARLIAPKDTVVVLEEFAGDYYYAPRMYSEELREAINDCLGVPGFCKEGANKITASALNHQPRG